MQKNLIQYHKNLVSHLENELSGNRKPLRIKKKTISNLFRYSGRRQTHAREIDLSEFNKPLYLDSKNKTLDVLGLATWEQVVDFTLPRGFLPLITPELKHITVGGATVGIGIESNTYRFGFVHDSLLEADVLLPNGKVITSSPTNKHKDLFNALANSYGTLGYVLRAKIKLRPAKKYVSLTTQEFASIESFLSAMEKATRNRLIEHVEGLVYGKSRLFLTIGKQTDSPKNLKSIYGNTIFYKEISKVGQVTLPTKEYIFRYDPEWFWNLPENPFYNLFRKIVPKSMRNSAFYTRYASLTAKIPFLAPDKTTEQFIQDWEVPWKYAKDLLSFALEKADLNGLPFAIVPVKVPQSSTLYPLKKNLLYLNLGTYTLIKKVKNKPAFYHTKIIDDFSFSHDGIKMLYSSTFLSKTEFDNVYNGKAYERLKKKYDPLSLLPTLFEKAVKNY